MSYTFKFVGLSREDSETPYYYGSLPAKPEVGQVLSFETGNQYKIRRIEGKGLTGDSARTDQQTLAWREIAEGKKVPTLFVQKTRGERAYVAYKTSKAGRFGRTPATFAAESEKTSPPIKVKGKSFDPEDVKKSSQENRRRRFSGKKPKNPQ